MKSNEVLQYCDNNLPGPLLRHVLDFAQILPKFSKTCKQKLRRHFKNRMCQYCGEYLDFPIDRLYQSENRPSHIKCKQIKYQRKKERFLRTEVYLDEFICPDYVQDYTDFTWRFIRPRFNTPCSIIIKSSASRFSSEISFYVKHNVIRDFSFYPKDSTYISDNPLKLHSMDFTIENSQSSSISSILKFLLQNNRIVPYQFHFSSLLENIIRSETDINIKRDMVYRLDIHGIANSNYKWTKELLLEFPEIIEKIPEKVLNVFFHKNYTWFLSELCTRRPCIFKYISFQHK